MPDLIRAACLTHYADVARGVGIDPAKMLKSVGLPARGLTDPDIRIPSGAVRRLLEASASAAGIDDFGLKLAERGGLSNLGPVALVAREQPTVGAAMEALGRYIHIHNESIHLRIEQHGDIVVIAPVLLLGRPGAAGGGTADRRRLSHPYGLPRVRMAATRCPLRSSAAAQPGDLSSVLQLQCRFRG